MKQRRNKRSKPRFNLDGPKEGKGLQPIYLIYRYNKDENGKHIMLKYSTGHLVYRKNWDPKLQRARPGVNFPSTETDIINSDLRSIESFVIDVVKKDRNIKVTDFKNELDYLLGFKTRPKGKEDTTLVEYCDKYINKSNKHKRTIMKYNTTRDHLVEYEKFINQVLTFEMITPEFSEKFVLWLYNHCGVDSPNTASKHVQIIKEVMRDAYENNYHNFVHFQSKKFNIKRVKTSKHFLELDDLEKLTSCSDKLNDQQIKVRDLWLIAAYSGLRYSDFSRLKAKHIIEEDGIKMISLETYKGRTTKADTEVVIPVLPELEVLLEKYNYKTPEPFHNKSNLDVLMNRSIKEVARIAGLDRVVENKTFKKGKLDIQKVPLYKKITNHVARYTFINVMLNDFDIPPIQLRKVTGQTLKVLMQYERGDKRKNAKKVLGKVLDAKSSAALRVVS